MTIGQIKSARRTLEVFEMFATVQKPLSVTAIAKRMSMPQSSTSELLQSLVTLGYLDHDVQARTYYPTLRIGILSTWMYQRHEQFGDIPAQMSEVAEATGENVLLAMRNGINSQYVLGQLSGRPNEFCVENGELKPLTSCASGWALLAYESDQEIGKIVRRVQAEAECELHRRTASCALEGVKRFRERGYAMSRGHSKEGVSGVAIRLRQPGSRTQLALSVSGPIERIEKKKTEILNALCAFNSKLNHDRISLVLKNEVLSAAER